MYKPLLVCLLMLMLNTLNVTGIYECCPGENILFVSTKNCSNANGIDLNCQIRFPVTDNADFSQFGYTLLDNGTLRDTAGDKEITYCHSKQGDYSNATSLIYIVCVEEPNDFDSVKFDIQGILGCISSAFIILTIIIYCMVPSLLDLQGICIMHTLVGLASGFIFLGVLQLKTDHNEYVCKAFAYIAYFSFLYLFFWLVVLSFHIWRTTVKPHLSNGAIKWSIVYHIIGIGGPAISLIIVLLAHYSPSPMWDAVRPGFGEVSCWFSSNQMKWIYFYGPLTVLLIFNVIFYLWTVVSLWGQVENTHNKVLKYRNFVQNIPYAQVFSKYSAFICFIARGVMTGSKFHVVIVKKIWLKLCIRLCIIMGITWIIEIITFIINGQVTAGSKIVVILLFLTDLINTLQGISIFLILVVFRRRLRRALASKNICNIRFPNSWKYLEDEEMESIEEKVNGITVEYKDVKENSDAFDVKR